jgi:fructokinase
LGNEVFIISGLGDDDLGREARERVVRLGLDDRFIRTVSGVPTGTVEVYFDEHRNPDYTIIPDVAYDRITVTDELLELVSGADALCFGTLAQRDETSRRCLSKLLGAFRGRHLLLDLNLRKDCYTEDIVRTSVDRADILKLNEEEAGYLAGIFGLGAPVPSESLPGGQAEGKAEGGLRGGNEAAAVGLAAELREAGDLSYCVVTLGPRGAAVAWNGGAKHIPGYAVELADPLGAGDAFTAAFLTALLQGIDPVESARRGNLLGSIVAGQPGATEPAGKI